jgi:DNA-binding CsgD family transcriptional regulator
MKSDHNLIRISQHLAIPCNPLKLIGIEHFSYMKQLADGTRINLSNKAQWVDDYYNLKLYQSSLYEDNLTNYTSGHHVTIGGEDLEVFRHGMLYYNTLHGIVITKADPDCCEFFLFGFTADNLQAVRHLLDNMEVLYHFIGYLKAQCSDLFIKAEKSKILLPNNRIIFTGKSAVEIDFAEIKKEFFQKTKIYKYNYKRPDGHKIKLSNREIDCIAYIKGNLTAKMIAKKMNLSHRTVEAYLENIKTKFNITDKHELLRVILQDDYLGCLRDY